MISMLLFILGAVFVLCAYQKLWILVGLTVFIAFLVIIYYERKLHYSFDKELVVKKLCLLYVITCAIDPEDNNKLAKFMRRILKELALDTCGMGQFTTWVKWEAYYRRQLLKEEKNE